MIRTQAERVHERKWPVFAERDPERLTPSGLGTTPFKVDPWRVVTQTRESHERNFEAGEGAAWQVLSPNTEGTGY